MLLESPIEYKKSLEWKIELQKDLEKYDIPLSSIAPKIIKHILTKLDKIKEGIQIFHLITLQTFIKRSGVEYLQQKFSQKIKNKSIKLINTKHWFHQIIQKNLFFNNSTKLNIILSNGFIDLLQLDNSLINYEDLPETLENDKYLLEEIQNNIQIICATIALYFVLNGFLIRKKITKKCSDQEFVNELSKRIKYLLLNKEGTTTIQTVINTLYSWISKTIDVTEHATYRDEIMKLIDNTVNTESQIFQITKKRILQLCKCLLCESYSNFIDKISKFKMYPFKQRIFDVYQKINTIVSYNELIHKHHYNTILESNIMMGL